MKTTTTLLLLLITLTTYSQGDDNTVNYTYDNAGNRTASCGNAFKSFGGNEQANGSNSDIFFVMPSSRLAATSKASRQLPLSKSFLLW